MRNSAAGVVGTARPYSRRARVAIVGGGIAGSALALALRDAPVDVTLYDHLWDEPVVGTALGMWPTALRALDLIGVGDQVRTAGVPCTSGAVFDDCGRLLRSIDRTQVVLVARTDLLAILRSGHSDAVTVRPDRVRCIADLDADLIVGADGVHSAVRRQRWGDSPRSTGVTAVRGVVPTTFQQGGLNEYWGRRALFGMTPHPDGTNWFSAFPSSPLHDGAAAIRHVRGVLATFPAPVRQVVALATPDSTLVNPIVISRPLVRLVRGNAVLVGDSAHAMAPNLGRGACESLVDAVTLGRALTAYGTGAALRRYSRSRLVGPQLFRIAASAVMRLSLADTTASLRNTVLSRSR